MIHPNTENTHQTTNFTSITNSKFSYLYTLLFLVVVYGLGLSSPLFSLVFASIGLSYVFLRYSIIYSLIAIILIGVIAYFSGGWGEIGFYLLEIVSTGFLLSYVLRKRLGQLYSVLIMIFPLTLALIIQSFQGTLAGISELHSKENWQWIIKLYANSGIGESQLAELEESYRQLTELMIILYPVVQILTFIALVYLIYRLGHWFFSSVLLLDLSILIPLREWKIPLGMAYILAIGILAYISDKPAWCESGLNLIVLSGLAFLINGYAILTYFFWIKNYTRRLKIFWVFIIFFLMPLSLWALAILGLADIWLDTRKYIKVLATKEEEQ